MKMINRIFATALLIGASINGLMAQGDSDPNLLLGVLGKLLLVVAGFVIVLSLLFLFRLINTLFQVQKMRMMSEMGLSAEEQIKELGKEKSFFQRLIERSTKTVPLDSEDDILMDHDYDGIRELDNSLPPWWVWLFYITIIYSVIHLWYYHFSDYGKSQIEQYNIEMAEADEAVKAFISQQADVVDENNVEFVDDEAFLAEGKEIYISLCAVCHANDGGGGVGPNMTDNYWIHGGSIKDIFRTIKYGVPEKGMISWKSQLNPSDMHKVSSYLMTLVGTTPVTPKEPQGDLYEAEGAGMNIDSTAGTETAQDSTIGMVLEK